MKNSNRFYKFGFICLVLGTLSLPSAFATGNGKKSEVQKKGKPDQTKGASTHSRLAQGQSRDPMKPLSVSGFKHSPNAKEREEFRKNLFGPLMEKPAPNSGDR